jgi:NAD(P)-dependent dehydrogenase (short-subunit alcohol dehydrogenase family)
MRRLHKQTLLVTAAGFGFVLAARAAARWRRPYDLRDKVVLITGGSRGLGLTMARQLLHRGAYVAMCARDESELERARSDLCRHEGRVLPVPCDITDREQVLTMVDHVDRHFGRIDVLINNAGTIQVGPVELMTLTDYEEAMDVHF